MLSKNNFNVHFIGVCGAGMSPLAKYLKNRGFFVSGSDVSANEIYNELVNFGIKIYIGHDKNNVSNADIVVVSSSINCDNVEYLEAVRLKKAIYKRAELLGIIFSTFKNSVGFAGSHGKTTATSMATHVLRRSLLGFTAFIGGKDLDFGNFISDNYSKTLISEVCEFDRNIKYVSPLVSVVLNIDDDHLDCYIDRAKYKIICNDDKFLKNYKGNKVYTYGIKENADYMAVNLKSERGKYSFDCKLKSGKLIRLNLNVLGKHNIYNALSNVALFDGVFGFDEMIIKSGIESFNGVERRFEFLGKMNEVNLYADYCHHPTEIKESLKVYKELLNKNFTVVFQPHTYSRTEILFSDFVKVFKNEKLLIFNTYSAREKYSYLGSAKRLAKVLNRRAKKDIPQALRHRKI